MRRRVSEGDGPIAKAFGVLLRRLREERHLSQQKLAELSDCHRNSISDLECGKKGPSLIMLFQIANGLGVSPSELVRSVEETLAQAGPGLERDS